MAPLTKALVGFYGLNPVVGAERDDVDMEQLLETMKSRQVLKSQAAAQHDASFRQSRTTHSDHGGRIQSCHQGRRLRFFEQDSQDSRRVQDQD